MPLKSYIICRKKKRTPKQFYEHQLFLIRRQQNINNSKRMKKIAKEEKNCREFPEIDPISEQIIGENEDYIPIFKRAIELQNQRKMKLIMNEKKKNKEIDDMIRKTTNSSYYVNKDEINEFYTTQINWKNSIKKRNKALLIKKNEERKIEERKILSYKIKVDEYSQKLIDKKYKKFLTVNNSSKKNNNSKRLNTFNTFERLYHDSKILENKKNKKTKEFYNQLFKPSINHSYNCTRVKLNNKSKKKN